MGTQKTTNSGCSNSGAKKTGTVTKRTLTGVKMVVSCEPSAKTKKVKGRKPVSKEVEFVPKNRRDADEYYASKLELLIQEKRNEVIAKRAQIPQLKELLIKCKETKETLEQTDHILKIELEIAQIESNNELLELEKKFTPFLYTKQQVMARHQARGDVSSLPHLSQVYAECLVMLGLKISEVKIVDADRCESCDVTMTIHPTQSNLICPKCSVCRPYLEATSSAVAYGDEVECHTYAYQKKNHLREWINKIQGTENGSVPKERLDMVMAKLYQMGFREPDKIKKTDIYEAMRLLGASDLYEHQAKIHWEITGKDFIVVTPQQESTIKFLFRVTFAQFKKVVAKLGIVRSNFFSYPYALFRYCQMMGYDEFIDAFPLLKGVEKLEVQDRIFYGIMKELGWELDSKGRLITAIGIVPQ